MATVNIILIAKVTMQAALFAEYLDKHDGKEEEPDDDSHINVGISPTKSTKPKR